MDTHKHESELEKELREATSLPNDSNILIRALLEKMQQDRRHVSTVVSYPACNSGE